eukprot:TRINITY_DN439_c0_g1_i1.p1 TRINITY_DN439_c0_g1~~TRINITY_DN439_c0_g1_i1.p1  ORF type:complete len:298 (+),score=39.29 TRINITY_DN439_c0_g1_i1:94-894(+)
MSDQQTASDFVPPAWAASSPPAIASSAVFNVEKDGEIVETVPLNRVATIFGRSQSLAHVALAHPSLSRRHAAAIWDNEGALKLVDLGTQSGVFVNSEKLKANVPRVLVPIDRVRFGESTRRYIFATSSESTSKRGRGEETAAAADTKRAREDSTPSHVRAFHILAKHTGSRRPSSWREDTITRTREEAVARIEEFRKLIEDGKATFEEIATKESDCSSAKRGGDLGKFGRGQMQPPFEQAAFGLAVGEMSGLVETESGIHIILRRE